MIYRLIYTSKALADVDDVMLEDILSAARRNNAELDISGMLLFFDNDFIQVLEGRKKDVMALFERIEKDPRHTDVDLIFEEVETGRVFGDWRMAYLPLDPENARALCGNMDVKSIDQLAGVLKRPSRILQHFFKGMMGEMAKSAANKHVTLAGRREVFDQPTC